MPMEPVPVLIDYDMYLHLMRGVNPAVKTEIIRQIKNRYLYFTTIQGIQQLISLNEEGDLIINEKLLFQIISQSDNAIDAEKLQLYKEAITKSLIKYINILNGCGATIQIAISKNDSFSYEIIDCEPVLFAEIMEYLEKTKASGSVLS
jgi:hypothetical protein